MESDRRRIRLLHNGSRGEGKKKDNKRIAKGWRCSKEKEKKETHATNPINTTDGVIKTTKSSKKIRKTKKIIGAMNMGIIDDIKDKFADLKAEQKKKREFKKKLDFEKYKAVEIAKAKQEIKAAKEGKVEKQVPTMDDLLGYDVNDIKL